MRKNNLNYAKNFVHNNNLFKYRVRVSLCENDFVRGGRSPTGNLRVR